MEKSSFLYVIWDYLLITSPYLLLGLFVSGFLHTFFNQEKLKKFAIKPGLKGIIRAALFGVPLPLCSCSVVPTAVTIKKFGASNAATSAFLIATPESGIDSIFMTYSLMDLPMALFRPMAAFCSALLAGVFQLLWNDDLNKNKNININSFVKEKIENNEKKSSCCQHSSTTKANSQKKKNFWQEILEGQKFAFTDLVNDLSFWLVVGILSGALITYFVPANIFENLSPTLSRLMVLVIGIPLYICASASTPIAASLMIKGMSPGVALLFLLVGPATNFSNIVVMQKYIGKKGILLNVLAITLTAIIFSYFADYLYDSFNWPKNFHLEPHCHDCGFYYFSAFASVIMIILIVRGIYVEEILPRLKGKSKNHSHENEL